MGNFCIITSCLLNLLVWVLAPHLASERFQTELYSKLPLFLSLLSLGISRELLLSITQMQAFTKVAASLRATVYTFIFFYGEGNITQAGRAGSFKLTVRPETLNFGSSSLQFCPVCWNYGSS